jgi:hypothetical protein
MIKLIKGLFKKEKEVISLNINKINDYLKENGFSESNINDKVRPLFDEIKIIINEIKVDLNNLEKAELRNPNIHNKALQLMEGNRVAYVRRIELFLNSFNFYDKYDISLLDEIILRYKHDVESMNKATMRSFYIVSEFFKDFTQKVAINIKKIDNLVLKIEKTVNNDFSKKSLTINELLENYNEIKLKKDSLINSIKKLEEQINLTQNDLDEISKKEMIVKSSPSYKELSTLLLNKDNLKDELLKEKNVFSEYFSKIEPALKKYDYLMPNNKLLLSYLDNSSEAVLDDNHFEILILIDKIKGKIESNEIEFKDKKRDNILSYLNDINKNLLLNFKNIYNKINSELNEINVKINTFSVGRELSELEYKQEHLLVKLDKLKKDKENLDKIISKINLDDLLNDLKVNLENLIDKIVELKI